MARLFLLAASLSGFVSVALGAFAAHGLKERLDEYSLKVFHTGVDYQFWHSLALALVGVLCASNVSPQLKWAGISFLAGIFIFSGSLYVLALTGVKAWGAVTPIGGLAFLVGWAMLSMFAFKWGT